MKSLSRTTRRRIVQSSLAGASGIALGFPHFNQVSAKAQEEIELTFNFWGDLNEKAALEKSMSLYEEAYPNVNMTGQHIPADYTTKMQTLAAAGELPDVFPTEEPLGLGWAEEGLVLDVTPYRDQYQQLQDRMPQTFFYYEEGKTLGTMNAVECALLFFNRDLFDEIGEPDPPAEAENSLPWEEFISLAQRLTFDNSGRSATDPDFDAENIRQYGVTFPKWYFVWWSLLKSNKADIANEDGTIYTLNSPESVAVFQNLQDLIHTYHVSPTPSQESNMPATNVQFQSRRVAMTLHGQFSLMSLAASGVRTGIGVLPIFQEPATIFQGPPTVVNSQTSYPKEALDFVMFYNDPQNVPDLYTAGLMMPLETKYYTDQTFIDYWIKNDVHPPEFRTAAVDYLLNYSHVSPSGSIKNFLTIQARVNAGLDPIWIGEKSAQQALDELEAEVQPLLMGRYPTS